MTKGQFIIWAYKHGFCYDENSCLQKYSDPRTRFQLRDVVVIVEIRTLEGEWEYVCAALYRNLLVDGGVISGWTKQTVLKYERC